MDKFDLKKYLAEGKLLKEEKMDEKTFNALTKEILQELPKSFKAVDLTKPKHKKQLKDYLEDEYDDGGIKNRKDIDDTIKFVLDDYKVYQKVFNMKALNEFLNEDRNTKTTKELTKIFRKEFGLEGVPFDYYQDGKKIIINPEGFNPDGTLFDMKDDWKGDIIKAIRKHKKNWQSKPNFGGGITIYIKESSEEINENTFTSNPNIKKLKKGLTVRIKKNKNTSGPGTFTFGSAYKTGKIISIDKNEVTVEINKKPIIVTPVGSNGNMGGDFEIVNESKDLNENIVNDAAEIATNISQVSGEEPFNALIFAGIIVGMSTVASVGAIADVSGYRFSDVKDFFYDLWVKYRIKPIVKRLSKDPEVIELVKSGKPGWQNMLRGKLSDKEEKYVYDIYRKHFK